ncbi:MAG: hypothetical protein ACLQAT_26470 [Candidatus Binataceae bacterium]
MNDKASFRATCAAVQDVQQIGVWNGLDTLLPYQRQWVADQSAVKVIEKGRQIGLTVIAEAADDTLLAATVGAMRPDQHVYYLGYVKEMAREFIDACAMWARRYGKAFSDIKEFEYHDEFMQDGKRVVRTIQAFQILFASGHRIMALSSAPRNLRGKHGIVVIDEAAFHSDLPALLKAAMALLMWGGKVRIISTHDGADNAFNELVADIRAGRVAYSLHRVTFDDAIKEGLYRKVCDVTGKEWSLEAETERRARVIADYRDDADEELFCIPRAGGGIYLPSALVESRMVKDVPVLRWDVKYSFLQKTEYERIRDADDWIEQYLVPALARLDPKLMSVFGEDFARSGDLSVIWPLQIGQTLIRRTPFIVEMRNVAFNQQEHVLTYLIDHLPRFCGGAMDARGNGQYLAEQAASKYGSRIDQVMLSTEWYREQMPKYKRAFEDRMIELPMDADILSDHRMITMERGVPQIRDKREKDSRGGSRHGDSAIAGALAWYASNQLKAEYAYDAVPRQRPGGSSSNRADDGRDSLRSRFAKWTGF